MDRTDLPTRQPSPTHDSSKLAVLRDRAAHLAEQLHRDDLDPRETMRLANALDDTRQRIATLADHRDDVPGNPPLPRPGGRLTARFAHPGTDSDPWPDEALRRVHGTPPPRRVTPRALTQARSTLATGEQRLGRVHGLRAWRLQLRVESARATLRAAAPCPMSSNPCPSCGGAGGRTVDTSSGGVSRQSWQTCGTCRGTGTR